MALSAGGASPLTQGLQVVPGTVVDRLLAAHPDKIVSLVRETYIAHHHGATVNPDSYFLRFPDRPEARIIALPAALSIGVQNLAGIKWIASVPSNIEQGWPRASAVLVVNDAITGYPIGLLEAAGVSAARTAASAALAALHLAPLGTSCAFVGAGVIARTIASYLSTVSRLPSQAVVYDHDARSAQRLMTHLAQLGVSSTAGSLEDAVGTDLVVLATTASAPYITQPDHELRANQVVLNISLRDLAPELLVEATNVVDDVEHCLKAGTSPHLAEQLTGGRDFVTGTLAEVIEGTVQLRTDRPIVFSPFGLGVLDLAVGAWLLDQSRIDGGSITVADFFGSPTRW